MTNLLFAAVGIYLIGEGVASILFNPAQPIVWQVGRVIRVGIGSGLVYYGLKKN